MNYRIFLLSIIFSGIFLFSCRQAPIPNAEANVFGNDSIIVLQQFYDNTADHSGQHQAMRIREDSLGFAYIFKTPDCSKKDSENIAGKILCGTVIHGERIYNSAKLSVYKIFVQDKDSRFGPGYIDANCVLSSFEFMKDSACRIPENRKMANDSNCDNQNIILLEGIYTGKNLVVQNAFNCNGIGYCVYEVRINDYVTTDIITRPKFEINFKDALGLRVGDKVEVKIFHRRCCMPKVLNPEVLGKEGKNSVYQSFGK